MKKAIGLTALKFNFSSVEPVEIDSLEKRKRRREGILIAVLVFSFCCLTFAEFHLSKLSHALPFVTSIFFFGLLNFNLIILIGLIWLIFRNVGKLFIERRRRTLGSSLKTKLVIAFFSFSIIPTLLLFVISASYINSSFDKWFSLKIQNTLGASLEITANYYKNTDETAMHFAEHLSNAIGRRIKTPHQEAPSWIYNFLEEKRELLTLDAVEFYPDSLSHRVLVQRKGVKNSAIIYPQLALDLLDRAFLGERISILQHVAVGDLIRCLMPVYSNGISSSQSVVGVVVVNSYIAMSLRNKVNEIASVFDDYKDNTNPLKYPIKTIYLIILILITLVVLFVAIWIGLYIARELTVPVERLVLAAQAIGAGNLDVSISASGHDEIAVLVNSFNKMTQDLRENRKNLIQAGEDLEKRRLQLEAVLANIGTGVIAIDSSKLITTFNLAVSKLLQLSQNNVLLKNYKEVLKLEKEELEPLVQMIDRMFATNMDEIAVNPANFQLNFRFGKEMKILSAVATTLREGGADWGVVVVIDDMTHSFKEQREMAWREVARRIAHEIKNPLTPIKLSAQRLQRRFANQYLGKYQNPNASLLKECTETIIRHTDELKEMVNEFSNFARFPESSPQPNDLNLVIGEVVALFQQAHSEIQIQVSFERYLPVFDFDRDQIKRVMINLFDNSIAALKELPAYCVKKIEIATHYNDQLKIALIEVKDNGPGMEEEVKILVFEPYFSTKKEGTGLGLSIVKRIINDHDGFIRVRSSPGEGTQFLIELPTRFRQGLQRESV